MIFNVLAGSRLRMLGILPFASTATFATIAPRIEVYTKLACDALKPEYQSLAADEFVIRRVPPPSPLCGEDPEVQAAVAELITCA